MGEGFQKLIPFLNSHGISHFTTPPHTLEHNGTSERRHLHIVETGLSLFHHSSLPLPFWSYAFQTAVYLINHLPTPILGNKSPFQMLFNQSPNYAKLQPFGCLCFPWLRPYRMTKLEPMSSPCVFLGYSTSQSAYKCLHLETHRLYLSRHVKFVCDFFPFGNKSIQSLWITKLPHPSIQSLSRYLHRCFSLHSQWSLLIWGTCNCIRYFHTRIFSSFCGLIQPLSVYIKSHSLASTAYFPCFITVHSFFSYGSLSNTAYIFPLTIYIFFTMILIPNHPATVVLILSIVAMHKLILLPHIPFLPFLNHLQLLLLSKILSGMQP